MENPDDKSDKHKRILEIKTKLEIGLYAKMSMLNVLTYFDSDKKYYHSDKTFSPHLIQYIDSQIKTLRYQCLQTNMECYLLQKELDDLLGSDHQDQKSNTV